MFGFVGGVFCVSQKQYPLAPRRRGEPTATPSGCPLAEVTHRKGKELDIALREIKNEGMVVLRLGVHTH